jgi:REP element-mobilizing transposase RayT
MNEFDWDENENPLAYLITFRTYGTWLHGDERGAVDRHGQNIYGTPRVTMNQKLEGLMRENRGALPVILTKAQRDIVAGAIKDTCKLRGYPLHALNIRTNHTHVVAASDQKPDKLLNAFKANATRELRTAGLVDLEQQIWARGGSTRYLWKPAHVNGAIDYVLYGQGDDIPPYW